MWPTGFNGAIVKIYSPGILQNNKIQVNCLPTARTPGHLCDEDNYDDYDDCNEYDQYKLWWLLVCKQNISAFWRVNRECSRPVAVSTFNQAFILAKSMYSDIVLIVNM